MINVTKITKTCTACPSQWEGWTDDNRQIYVRYRWGYLEITVSKPNDKEKWAAVNGEIVFSYVDEDVWAGFMEYDVLKQLTRDVITFPEEESKYHV